MKLRVVLVIALCLAFVALIFQENHQQKESIRRNTFLAAYSDLSNLPDFTYVTHQTDNIFLLQTPDAPAQSAILPQSIASMLAKRQLLSLRKVGDDVFFITGGAVDDEFGYVISSDDQIYIDGLWHIDRVESGLYRFSTMK